MSQHKTSLSNWTAEDKKLYRERREKGLRGQTGAVTVHRVVKDEKGEDTLVPLGNTVGSRFFSHGQAPSAWQAAKVQQQAHAQQQRKGSTRGE